MYSEKIRSVANALGTLAGAVDEVHWQKIKAARAELWDAAEGVARLENIEFRIDELLQSNPVKKSGYAA